MNARLICLLACFLLLVTALPAPAQTARVEVVEINAEKNRLRLKTTCSNQDGTLVIDGEATVMPPKAPKG